RVGEVRRSGPRFLEKTEVSAPAVDPRQAQGVAHPEVVLAVRIHAADGRSHKALRIVRLVSVTAERQRFSLKVVQSGRPGADPDIALAVLKNRVEHVVIDAVRLEWRVAVSDRVLSVVIYPDPAGTAGPQHKRAR